MEGTQQQGEGYVFGVGVRPQFWVEVEEGDFHHVYKQGNPGSQ